jgi:3'(2'), 5'-bisphosphate nucleotidase
MTALAFQALLYRMEFLPFRYWRSIRGWEMNINAFGNYVKMIDYNELTKVMRKLSLEAGARIMEIYEADDFEVKVKSDKSPVTEADEAADVIISAGLRKAFPEILLVTEEQSETHGSAAEVFLIVDPLDGTKEFIQRRGDFTVNIALVENGVPTRGVVYAPARGRMFYTRADGQSVEETGSFDVDTIGTLREISVSDPDNSALFVVASKSHRDQATDDYIGKYALRDVKSAGSSLKFCLVATGEADLYPRLGRTMEWDTAAGHAVVRGAGGTVLQFDTLAPLAYGKPGFENPFFIVASPGVELRNS